MIRLVAPEDIRDRCTLNLDTDLILVNSSNENRPVDVLIVPLRGTSREEQKLLSEENTLLLIEIPERLPEEFKTGDVLADHSGGIMGCLLPNVDGIKDCTIDWWINELTALSLLEDPPADSFAELLPGLEKRDMFKSLARKSKVRATKVEEDKKIETIPFASFKIDEEIQKEFNDLLVSFLGFIKKTLEVTPHLLDNFRNDLISLRKNIDGNKNRDVELFVTGFFSAGKTTLLNQMFLNKRLKLPTKSDENTSTIFEINFQRNLDSLRSELRYQSKTKHVLLEKIDFKNFNSWEHFDHQEEFTSSVKRHWQVLIQEFEEEKRDFYGIYYLPREPSGEDLGFESEKLTENSLGLKLDWKYIVEFKKGKKESKAKNKKKEFKSEEKLKDFLEEFKCENEKINKDFKFDAFRCYSTLEDKGSYRRLNKVYVELKVTGRENPIVLENTDFDQYKNQLEDVLIPYIDPEVRIFLPMEEGFLWAQDITLVDTPGFQSKNIAHDRVTLNRFNLLNSSDIVLSVIPCRGGKKTGIGDGVDELKNKLLTKNEARHVIVVNSKSELTENNRNEIKRYVENKIDEMSVNIDINKSVYVIDLLDPDTSVREQFSQDISNELKRTLSYSVKKFSESLLDIKNVLNGQYDKLLDVKEQQHKIKKLKNLKNMVENTPEKVMINKLKKMMWKNERTMFDDARRIILKSAKENYPPSSDKIQKGIKQRFNTLGRDHGLNAEPCDEHNQPIWYKFTKKEQRERTADFCVRKIADEIKKIKEDGELLPETAQLKEYITGGLSVDEKVPYDKQRKTLEAISDVNGFIDRHINKLENFTHEIESRGKGRKILDWAKDHTVYHAGYGPNAKWEDLVNDFQSQLKSRSQKIRNKITDWIKQLVEHIYQNKLIEWEKEIEEFNEKWRPIEQFDMKKTSNELEDFRKRALKIKKEVDRNVPR